MIADPAPPSRGGIDFAPLAGPCPAACADGKPPAPFTPFMLGDFVGPVANLFTNFKIAEGESPRPVDRVFFKYNYYNNVDKSRWADPTEPIHNVHLNMYTFGMEQTFFNGNASVGVRVPFYTLNGEAKDLRIGPDPATGAVGLIPGGPALDETDFGNIMAIAKLVLWEDRPSGSLLSGGAVVSIPTASNRNLDPGLSTLMYVQPFSGFILNGSGDLFVHGFSSMTLPVARPESIISFTDVGVGYYAYRDGTGSRMVSAVVPTVEVHYTAAIRQPDRRADVFGFVDPLRVHDVVDVTLGTTFEFGRRATLGTGVALPVTGPKPFDAELLVQLNLLF
jgi:hypothetical protein